MQFVIQKCNESRLVIDLVVSIFCTEMSDVDGVKIIANHDQKTEAYHVKYAEFQMVVSQSREYSS